MTIFEKNILVTIAIFKGEALINPRERQQNSEVSEVDCNIIDFIVEF